MQTPLAAPLANSGGNGQIDFTDQRSSPKSDLVIPCLSHSKVLDYLAPSFMTTVYSPKIGLFQKADGQNAASRKMVAVQVSNGKTLRNPRASQPFGQLLSERRRRPDYQTLSHHSSTHKNLQVRRSSLRFTSGLHLLVLRAISIDHTRASAPLHTEE